MEHSIIQRYKTYKLVLRRDFLDTHVRDVPPRSERETTVSIYLTINEVVSTTQQHLLFSFLKSLYYA